MGSNKVKTTKLYSYYNKKRAKRNKETYFTVSEKFTAAPRLRDTLRQVNFCSSESYVHAVLTSSLRVHLELDLIKLITKTLYLINVQTNVPIILPMRHFAESKNFGKGIPDSQKCVVCNFNPLNTELNPICQ